MGQNPAVAATSAASSITVTDVGIRYPFLSKSETTFKGRLLQSLLMRRSSVPDFWAVRNVSFAIRSGEIVGILGRNGSGKSSLLRALAGVLPASEGSVETCGEIRPLLDITGGLNSEMTGRENAFLFGAINRIPRAEMLSYIPRILSFSELGVFFDSPVRTYSSGMLARLAFSLATQLNPDILLVDEVLSVGDESFQQRSYFKMVKLVQSGSIAVIVSHHLPVVEQLCTRAILLHDGKVEDDGPPASVIARYRKLIE